MNSNFQPKLKWPFLKYQRHNQLEQKESGLNTLKILKLQTYQILTNKAEVWNKAGIFSCMIAEPKLEIFPKYFLDKNFKKQPLCGW